MGLPPTSSIQAVFPGWKNIKQKAIRTLGVPASAT
jgi:hypothetical protein